MLTAWKTNRQLTFAAAFIDPRIALPRAQSNTPERAITLTQNTLRPSFAETQSVRIADAAGFRPSVISKSSGFDVLGSKG